MSGMTQPACQIVEEKLEVSIHALPRASHYGLDYPNTAD